ncbi:hypothetical protein [Roseovarius amoyensis]|nr:hypothetical protein [Roseovarius amoyensis]
MGVAEEPEAATLQIERLHRGFEELSDGDRAVIEDMIGALKTRARKAS